MNWGTFISPPAACGKPKRSFRLRRQAFLTPGAFDSLGDIAMRQGQRDAAEHAYRQAVGLDEFDFRGHFGLAAILAAKGRKAEAADQYRAGLSVDPHNQEAQAALQRLTANSPHGKTPKP